MKRRYAGPSIVVFLFFLTLAMLAYAGRASRTYLPGHAVYSVGEREDALSLWRNLGLHGRIVVYFDEHLSLDDEFLQSLNFRFASMDHLLMHTDAHNYFIQALYEDIFREVYQVVPDGQWQEISEKLSGYPFVENDGRSFRYTIEGVPFIISRLRDLPAFREKVVIYTYSSFMRDYGGAEMEKLLNDPGIADVVAVRREDDRKG